MGSAGARDDEERGGAAFAGETDFDEEGFADEADFDDETTAPDASDMAERTDKSDRRIVTKFSPKSTRIKDSDHEVDCMLLVNER